MSRDRFGIQDSLPSPSIRETSGPSEISWEVALDQLGITQEQVDAVNLDEWVIEGA